MLKWYMLMCRNAEGVHGKQKVGSPCSKSTGKKKIVEAYCECSTMTALVLTFGAKAFKDKELCKACLAGGNTTVISTGETNKNVTVRFLKKTHGLRQLYTSFFFAVFNSST